MFAQSYKFDVKHVSLPILWSLGRDLYSPSVYSAVCAVAEVSGNPASVQAWPPNIAAVELLIRISTLPTLPTLPVFQLVDGTTPVIVAGPLPARVCFALTIKLTISA